MSIILDEIYEGTTTWISFKRYRDTSPLPAYINTLLDWRLTLMGHMKDEKIGADKKVVIELEIEATDRLLDICNNF